MNLAGHPARGRVAALALLVLLMAAIWVGPISLYLGLVGAGAEQIAGQARLLQRYRTLARLLLTEAATEPPDASAVMRPESPEAQAIALLQETVKKAALASRVEVRSLQVLRSETLPSAVRIGVRINAAGDMAGLARLLFAVEAARPVLYPDNLQIRSRAATPGKAPEALDLQLDVSGFAPGASR
jgi:general secretion pathway protein M